MSRDSARPPVNAQPRDLSHLFEFKQHWHRTLMGSFKPCPRSGFACCCTPCYIGKVLDRSGDNYCTGYFNPCSLMALRTKIRTSFRIEGSLVQDCLVSLCCLAPCAAMQIDYELDRQGIPSIGGKRMM